MIGRLPRLASEDGFTLVEMLTAMTVLAILIAAYTLVLGSAVRHSGEVEQQTNLQVEARGALASISQDLRQAYDGDGDVATSPIESVSSTQITFLSVDRAQPFHVRRLSYRLNTGKLERARATSTDTDGYPWTIPALSSYLGLVGSVANSTVFTFKDANGATTSTASAVRTVGVTLTVVTKTTPSRQYTYKTSVTLRSAL